MKEYCLTFHSLSIISKLPDAQTIFGYLCTTFLQTKGEEAFKAYIDSFNTKPLLVHSSMFPYGVLPMISENLYSIKYINQELLKKEPAEQLAYLSTMKELKKISYMSMKVYNTYIAVNNVEAMRQDLLNGELIVKKNCLQFKSEDISIESAKELNTHVKKTGMYTDLDNANQLYYDEAIYSNYNHKYCIYVKTDLSKEEINDLFKYTHYFGLGPKHSVGKNSFKLDTIDEITVNSSDIKLLLSKAILDDDVSLDDSSYNVISKVQRSSQSYMSNKLIGRFNLIGEGSYITTNNHQEWYGKVIENEYDGKKIYHYCIGYTF